jgi:hypothetical protein
LSAQGKVARSDVVGAGRRVAIRYIGSLIESAIDVPSPYFNSSFD